MTLEARAITDALRIFTSHTIKILAGGEKKEFTIHVEALRLSGSQSLAALCDGRFKESIEGAIDWSHTDHDTVERFLSYLYVGDYDAPLLEVYPAIDDCTCKKQKTLDPDGDGTSSNGHVSRASSPASTRISSLNSPFDPFWSNTNSSAYFQTWGSRFAALIFEHTCFTGFEEVLFAHGKLLVFANYHDVPKLASLALGHLTYVLSCMNWGSDIDVMGLAKFVQYIYANTVRRDEPIRTVLANCYALNCTKLVEDYFLATIEEVGEFAADTTEKIVAKLRDATIDKVRDTKVIEMNQTKIESLTSHVEKQDKEINRLKSHLEAWRSGKVSKG